MDTYQSTGKIKQNGTVVSVQIKTYLPRLLKGGQYSYKKFYNISNDSMFGLLGILSISGEPNTDLNKYNSTKELVQVNPSDLDLNDLKPIGDGKDFASIKKGELIHFICFHDDQFAATDSQLEDFQMSLPKIPIFREPKVGNGGILTFDDI